MMQDLKSRLFGLVVIAVGLGFGWFFIWEPLEQARHGARQVDYSVKAFILVPACVSFGLAFLLLGSQFRYRNDAGTNFTVIGWVVMGLVVVSSGVGFWWFQQQFAALGYR